MYTEQPAENIYIYIKIFPPFPPSFAIIKIAANVLGLSSGDSWLRTFGFVMFKMCHLEGKYLKCHSVTSNMSRDTAFVE